MAVPYAGGTFLENMKHHTPLQVMLSLMRTKWDAEDWDGAAALARQAAPYVHARAVSHQRNSPDLSQLTDDELNSYGEGRGMEAEAEDQA